MTILRGEESFVDRESRHLSEKLYFKILAPLRTDVPPVFSHTRVDSRTHEDLIFNTQLMRGQVIRRECHIMALHLLSDGRHFQQLDAQSWHILLEDCAGRLMGCARYRPIWGGFEQLSASESALAGSRKYGPALRSAIERHLALARRQKIQYGEVGTWVLRPEVRCSTAAVNVALMTLALAAQLGGGLGVTTATRSHHSASILRRLGGRRLEDLPAYYEPKYGSVIEVLEFNLANLDPRYSARFDKLRDDIRKVPVICSGEGAGFIEDEGPAFHIAELPIYPAPGNEMRDSWTSVTIQ